MREKNFQVEFGKWIKENMKESAAFELKVTSGGSLPFSAVQEHQLLALHHAKHSKIYHKIPDVGFQNPFDCFILYKVPAFVVIRFKSHAWYAIDIDIFEEEMKVSVRRSITEGRAMELSTFSSLSDGM